jgi:hypothetical protein
MILEIEGSKAVRAAMVYFWVALYHHELGVPRLWHRLRNARSTERVGI